MKLYTARWLLADAETFRPGGGVLVDGGRVLALAAGPGEVARLAARRGGDVVDLGDVLLGPALVDAHAHLDLTSLGGRVTAERGFGAWIARLLEERRGADPADLARGVLRGADRLIATGTARVGDVDSTGLAAAALGGHPLAALVYHEALDAGDPARTGPAAAAADAFTRERNAGTRIERGLSPHAPFTVSRELFARLGRVARDHSLAVTIHWSETEAEVEWLRDGTGPLAELLGPAPRASGLDLIEAAGLLGPRTSLVHGNLPAEGEPERIARAGAVLVHCPGTHRFFGRHPFPLETYRRAGVQLALGTDSLASNEDLDVRREMAILRSAHPTLDPESAWRMATVGAAAALGRRGGVLAPDVPADFCAYGSVGRDRRSHLESLTSDVPAVEGIWVAGSRVPAGGSRAGASRDR